VLRALREAQGVTQAGWAASLGVSETTVRRWERGAAVPTADIEQALHAHCAARGLFRTFDHGPLRGAALTPAVLSDLLAEARLAARVERAPQPMAQPERDDQARSTDLARLRRAEAPTPTGTEAPYPIPLPPRAPALTLVPRIAPESPRTVTQPAQRLPVAPTPLIGREALVDALRARLHHGDVRLLTLTGPPGTGKTRLALEVAWAVVDDFTYGVAFVDLAPVQDPTHVIAAVAHVLGVREGDAEPLPDRLKAYLATKHLLLVLDNFEQVLDAAPAVADLLARCPRLTVLVTSRAALRLRGEHRIPVPPLELPEMTPSPDVAALAQSPAVALFVQRAEAVYPEFRLTSENGRPVAEVCIRLDGLPLAIELAAARIDVLPPEALRARLEQRLPLLTGGARDAPGRHQTLRAAIAWSYELLTPAEQRLFRCLGAFAGGATLAAVAAVADSDDRALLEVLTGLVDQGLLYQEAQPDGEPRFRILETLREYAVELLAAQGEEAATRERHATYFLTLAEEAEPAVKTAAQPAWLARLEREHDNLRAALQWAIVGEAAEHALRLVAALAWFWVRHGHLSDGRRWTEAAVALPGATGHPRLRAKALFGAGFVAWNQGDAARGLAALHEAAALGRELGDERTVAYALTGLTMMACFAGDHPAAAATGAESVTLARAHGEPWALGFALQCAGTAALFRGEVATAGACCEEALAILRRCGDQWAVAGVLLSLAHLDVGRGDYAAARTRLEEAVALDQALGDYWRVAHLLCTLGSVAWLAGDTPAAAARYQDGLALSIELGYQPGQIWCLAGLVGVSSAQGDVVQAAHLGGAVDSWATATGYRLMPAEQAVYEQGLAGARDALGEQAFTAAYGEGRSMSLDQAIAEILPQTSPSPCES
jgi:non-specific serine/threonine protein kinase